MAEIIKEHNGIRYTAYTLLEDTGLIRHGFMTRIGGVSRGVYGSMDLSFDRGDEKENVLENFRLASSCFGTGLSSIVTAQQTHTANIRAVTAADAGKGIIRDRDYTDIDGIITDEPGLLLSTAHADCTPVFLFDPVKKVIGMVHSGWKGTAGRISGAAVLSMHDRYGSEPSDIIAAIGPCICGDCYEIGPEVAEIFMHTFNGDGFALKKKSGGKYLLDLKAANRRILNDAGVPSGHIDISGLCTFEREDLFFSYRRMGPKRGQMAAFIMLK